jgi:hypothetical protein
MERIEILPITGKGQPEGHAGSYGAAFFRPFLMQGTGAQRLLEGVRSRSAALDTSMQIDGDIGPRCTTCALSRVHGVFVGRDGVLLISDSEAHRIWVAT